jgi:hypothetical protein
MKTLLRRFLVLAGVLSLVLLHAGCDMVEPRHAGGSTSTETGDKFGLSGRVLGSNGGPLAGVVVNLKGSALTDTTDVFGAWEINGFTKANNKGDTVLFELIGQTLAQVPVTRRVATLRDVQLQTVQRGFTGFLSPSPVTIGRIEGLLTGDGITEGDTVRFPLHHNILVGNYSGFAYFPPSYEQTLFYSVLVRVFDENDKMIGKSHIVTFNSISGDVTLPTFEPGNLLPSMAKATTSLPPQSNP